MKRHISARARIELRGGERVGVSTVSTTVARSFNGDARSNSQAKVLVSHQAASLSRRIYYELWTHVPAELERFKLFAPGLDDDTRTMRVRVVVQSA